METYAARAPPGRALFRARISTPRHLAVFVPARLRESPAVNLARAARFPGRGSTHAPKIPLKRFQMHFQKLFLPMNADAALYVGGYFAANHHTTRHKMYQRRAGKISRYCKSAAKSAFVFCSG